MELLMAEFNLAALISGAWCAACWLAATLDGTPEWDTASVCVISNTCAFPAATYYNVCWEKGPWLK